MSRLDLLPASDLGGLAEWYAAQPLTARFDPTRRWYSRLARTDDHEAWLLSWLPGQGTDLHDHGGSSGAFTVVAGYLTEQIPARGALTSRGYGAGATRRFGSRHVHRVTNTGTVPAVSLHVYAPALTRMTRYDLTDGQLRIRTVERAGEDW